MPVGKKIKLIRIARDLKIDEIVNQAGINRNAIAYIEKRKTVIPFIQYLKYLRSKGIDLNKIFEDEKGQE